MLLRESLNRKVAAPIGLIYMFYFMDRRGLYAAGLPGYVGGWLRNENPHPSRHGRMGDPTSLLNGNGLFLILRNGLAGTRIEDQAIVPIIVIPVEIEHLRNGIRQHVKGALTDALPV